jgi:hypothetical protein
LKRRESRKEAADILKGAEWSAEKMQSGARKILNV